MYLKIRQKAVNVMAALPFGVGDFLMHSEFTRNMIKLSTGTAIVTALGFCITPINTRLFTPEMVGTANLILTIATTFGCVIGFGLNPVILMEKRERTAEITATLAVILTFVSLACAMAVLFFFTDFFLDLLKAQKIKPYLWMAYISMLVTGLVVIPSQFIQRRKLYGKLAKVRIGTAILGHCIRLPWGFFTPSFIAIYVGSLICSIVSLPWSIYYGRFHLIWKIKALWAALKRNITFMFFQTLNAISGVIASKLPMFWIAAKCSLTDVGYYGLAMSLVDIPLNLFLSSFQSVYYKRIADTVNNEPEKLMSLYWRNTKKIFLIGLAPCLLMLAVSPLIPFILSEKWASAMPIFQMFVITRIVNLLSTPTYAIVTVLRKNYVFTVLTITFLIRMALALYLGGDNVVHILFWVLVLSLPFHALLIFWTTRIIKKFQRSAVLAHKK